MRLCFAIFILHYSFFIFLPLDSGTGIGNAKGLITVDLQVARTENAQVLSQTPVDTGTENGPITTE